MGGLLRFESGSLGFSFLRAFHIRQILQLGPPPRLDAWKIDAMRKQEERTAQPKEERDFGPADVFGQGSGQFKIGLLEDVGWIQPALQTAIEPKLHHAPQPVPRSPCF